MTTVSMEQKALRIKGSMFTATVLQLQSTDLGAIAQQLTQMTIQAPQFFQQAPTVIDVAEVVNDIGALDFEGLLAQLRIAGLLPVGMVGATPEISAKALKAGLATMPLSKNYKPTAKPTETEAPPPAKVVKSLLIDVPVRSGQRIYAKESDLVVIGAVSHGAEVIADGHIHIYGALHGRALAGASGNTEAQIFCQRLNAELVAIAGVYRLSESFEATAQKGPVRIMYQTDTLCIRPLH